MQLQHFKKMYDADGDGLTDRTEFAKLLAATGSTADANVLFDQLDTDKSGALTDAEIKALGQDQTGAAARRDGGK